MTHPNFVTNGASLEDCHTNFFALADLCGIKWRRFYADTSACFEPLDDPVLSSFSKCLAADVLCVWRRVAPQGLEQHRHNLQDANQLSYKKELWVFWYGDEPALNGLVSADLNPDSELGSWEIGLSYECRALLFKSLHNLIERNLLSRGFSRLGRWFVQPHDGAEKTIRSPQLSFCFNFFIHGDSTVCASVDVRQRIPVCQLTRQHLQLAQGSHTGLKVILCPYGMAGTLTGQSYKETDITTQRLLGEWHLFYPLRSKTAKDLVVDDHVLSAVEVIVGGIKMRYPANYVLVTELDEHAAIGQNPGVSNASSSFCASQSKTSFSHFNTSPCDPTLGAYRVPPSDTYGDTATGRCSSAWKIREAVWQDSGLQARRQQQDQGDQAGAWDFSDPSALVRCNCSRCKTASMEKTNSKLLASTNNTGSPAVAIASPSPSVDSPSSISNVTSAPRKADKAKPVAHLRTSIPFHKRSAYSDMVEMDTYANHPFAMSSMSGSTLPSTNFQFKGLSQSLRASTPSGLPQLHTSVAQPSSPPHAYTPLTDGANSQVTEPSMPTLSPHPPPIKDEEEEEAQSLSESQDQNNSSMQNTCMQSSPSATVDVKEKISNDQVSSPFQNNVSNLIDTVKNEESLSSQVICNSVNGTTSNGNNCTPGYPEESKSISSQILTAAATPVPMPSLKRPSLTVCSHDDPHDELVMDGLLYDYTYLNCSLWENAASKRRRLWTSQKILSDFSDSQYIYAKDGSNHLSLDDSMISKKKDPYEFNDEFDEDSPSSNFRIKMEEEEIKKENGLPPTPESQALTPGQVQTGPLTPTQDALKPASAACEQISVSSPQTPRTQGFPSERDLQITEQCLPENIFDSSSSDDSADDVGPATPMSSKVGTPEEPITKHKNNSSGILGHAELTRMFPTPPSLENNNQSPPGPQNGMDITTVEGTECSRDTEGDYETVKDWSYVYKVPNFYKFVGSKRYAPLSLLPSLVQPITLSVEHSYKPSWSQATSQSSNPTTVTNSVAHNDRLTSNPQYPMVLSTEGERIGPPMYSLETSVDQRNMSMNYELQSPLPSASYLNKHINSVDGNGSLSSIPEAHSLLVNLVIADSMLNLFKDHNFSSCTLCVCNMNTKGADAGINLPSSLIPSGTDEPQYKCTCGFSAVVNRHQSHRSGIFYEDELDITGHRYETFVCRKSLALVESGSSKKAELDEETNTQVDHVPHNVVDLIRIQCSHIYSTFSLFHKAEQFHCFDRLNYHYNALEVSDGCEVCFLALDTGRQAIDNVNNKIDDNLKSSCLHKWPYLAAKVPVSNLEVVHLLRSLQPVLQEAVQQKRQRMWEVTYPVLGPLTWRQFHRLAGRGTEDQCEPQPIPSILVGYDKDWVALSPFALKYWDKLLLEPYTNSRDIAYVVVAPDSDSVLSHIKMYFKELSTIYELCRLGRHCPITKVLRDGIMRVGKSTAKKLADEPIDEWFNLIGEGPIASRLKLYAQACRYHLAPHLATQSFDSSLIDAPPLLKPPEKPLSVASPRTTAGEDQEKSFKTEPDIKSEHMGSNLTETPISSNTNPDSGDGDDSHQTPTVVIYLVEPFTYGTSDSDVYRLASLGLLRSYTHMLQFLPDHLRSNIHLQVVTLDSILSLGRLDSSERRKDQLKALAFSVFSQCHQMQMHHAIAKSLTGFGPAASQDLFLKSRDARSSIIIPPPSKVFTLAPQKDKQTELGEMFGDRREKSSILYCTYCLTEDQRWMVATCTDEKGDILETCCVSVEVPNRTRRKKVNVRKMALCKLLDFIVEVLSKCLHSWRLVISRLGRLGHGELRDWATLLSRKSLLRYSRQLRELCHQCSVLGSSDSPAILSACLVSLEPDSALRILPDQFTPDERFSSSCNSCDLSTPEDASATHILVFPTSATTQSSQATFQQEHIDPLSTSLADDDIFQALNEDDIAVGGDINDIFQWTESPHNSPSASPRRDSSLSQPGSPNQAAFHHGGTGGRGSGNLLDMQEEPLQLLQQPLALGYYVSTAKTGPMPKWFWATCPQLQNICPVFLKSALLIHSPSVQQNSDDLLHTNPQHRNYHPLDSNLTTDVLRCVLEGFNTLSWLSLDPSTHDRRSCLPVHIQVLMQLYQVVEALM